MKEVEPKFSFFNLIGYLFPGIVFLTLLLPLIFQNEGINRMAKNAFMALLSPNTNTSFLSISVGLIIPLLAITFLLGVFLSAIYSWAVSMFFLRDWRSDKLQIASEDCYYIQLKNLGVSEALNKNFLLRECLAYHHMGGLDLYAIAARARMLGASGFSIILLSFGYIIIGWLFFILLLVIGVIMVLLAQGLHKDYNSYVDINAFLFQHFLKPSQEFFSRESDELIEKPIKKHRETKETSLPTNKSKEKHESNQQTHA